MLGLPLSLFSTVFAKGEIPVYAFVHNGFLGEKDAVVTIADAIARNIEGGDLEVLEMHFSDEKALLPQYIQTLQKQISPHIIVTSGSYGAELLKRLPPNPHRIAVHASHQLSAFHQDLGKFCQFIALPNHLDLDQYEKALRAEGAQLIRTRGVAHSFTPDSYKKAFAKLADRLPKFQKPIILWYLGGDAPDVNGELKLYTENSVRENLEGVLVLTQDRFQIVVIDGPRTGQIDPQTLKPRLDVHIDQTLNPITASAARALEEKGWRRDKDFFVFTFIKDRPSLKDALIWDVLTREGIFVIPGESTSVITASYDTMPGSRVVVQENSAMNDSHRAYLKRDHRIRILDSKGQISSPHQLKSKESLMASEQILCAVLSRLNKK